MTIVICQLNAELLWPSVTKTKVLIYQLKDELTVAIGDTLTKLIYRIKDYMYLDVAIDDQRKQLIYQLKDKTRQKRQAEFYWSNLCTNAKTKILRSSMTNECNWCAKFYVTEWRQSVSLKTISLCRQSGTLHLSILLIGDPLYVAFYDSWYNWFSLPIQLQFTYQQRCNLVVFNLSSEACRLLKARQSIHSGNMLADCLLIVFISICTAFLGEGSYILCMSLSYCLHSGIIIGIIV